PPPVDLAAERRNGDFVRGEIRAGRVAACHDLSDGGLLTAIAEMAMAGGRGVQLEAVPESMTRIAYLFGEDQGRYLIETAYSERLPAAASPAGVPASVIGRVGGVSLTLPGAGAISVDTLKAANEAWLPGFMAQA